MKKYILSVLLLTTTLVGCYDLDRFPGDQVSSGIFWQNETQLKQAIMGVYTRMRQDQVYGYYPYLDCVTDIATGYDAPSYEAIFKNTMTPSSSIVNDKWKNLYDGVARANLVLQNIDRVSLDPEAKKKYLGEVYFLRALYYNELMKFFGAVPLYDESVVVAESFSGMLKPRSPLSDVREFILKDLEKAIGNLPIKWDQANNGRATKGAAYALRGKIYLFAKDYAKATLDFEELVYDKNNQGYGYKLHPVYADLFKPTGHRSDEMIFAVQNIGGVGMDYGMPFALYAGTRSTFGSCWNNSLPSTYLVDLYENLDGSNFNWDDHFAGFNASNTRKAEVLTSELTDKGTLSKYTPYREQLLRIFEQRDPRLLSNVIMPYTNYLGWLNNKENPCEFIIHKEGGATAHESNQMIRVNGKAQFRPYVWRKFVPEGDMNGGITNRMHTPINYPVIRYADVLLLLAECYNETGGKESQSIGLINEVRTRAKMPLLNSGPSFLVVSGKDQVFDRIMRERAFELCGEGHRYFDLIRWGKAVQVMNRSDFDMLGAEYAKKQFATRNFQWPIPSAELDLNPTMKPNNDGW